MMARDPANPAVGVAHLVEHACLTRHSPAEWGIVLTTTTRWPHLRAHTQLAGRLVHSALRLLLLLLLLREQRRAGVVRRVAAPARDGPPVLVPMLLLRRAVRREMLLAPPLPGLRIVAHGLVDGHEEPFAAGHQRERARRIHASHDLGVLERLVPVGKGPVHTASAGSVERTQCGDRGSKARRATF